MDHAQYTKELLEAIEAADYALSCLQQAKTNLNNARNWGVYDILGGGFISTLIKRSKMSDAEKYMEAAKQALERFQKELNDVDKLIDLNFNTSDLLSFADFFFDGFLADWLVQGRINEARESVDQTIREVKVIKQKLEQSLI